MKNEEDRMSVQKQYLKTKSVCKVTFNLPKDVARSAGSVYLVGDFNGCPVFGQNSAPSGCSFPQ